MKPLPRVLAGLGAVVAVATALLATALPATAAEPWLDEDFSGGVDGVFDEGFGAIGTSQGFEGAGLVSRIPRGQHWGTSTHWNTAAHLGSEPDEMWIRYLIKFPEGFTVADGYRGKLPGFGGLYTYNCLGGRASTPSAPCWSARMMFTPLYEGDGLPSYPVDRDEVTRLGFYPYLLNSNDVGRAGVNEPWNANVATLNHGEWYCVESRVKLNTPGQSNGILEGFVNGAEAYSADNLRFRRSGESNLHVKSLWFDVYHGGDATSPRNNEIFFDDLAAGPERIGCGDFSSSGEFIDDDDSVFEEDIDRLARSGITRGCNPPENTRFCPEAPVTRGQMAAFLHRALDDRIDAPQTAATSPPDFFGVRSDLAYRDALTNFAAAGAPADIFNLTYPIDDTSLSRDWLSDDPKSPSAWVPLQLDAIRQAGAVPFISLEVDSLPGLVSDAFDDRIDAMVEVLAGYVDTHPDALLIIDPLPGSNTIQQPYGGDDPTSTHQGFALLTAALRDRISSDNLLIVYTPAHEMRSSTYSADDFSAGAPEMFYPSSASPDLIGIRARSTDGAANPVAVFAPAIQAHGHVAGLDVPIFLIAGAADQPSASAQNSYFSGLAEYVETHPQLVGLVVDDVTVGAVSYRVSDGGVSSGFVAATAAMRNNGLAWLGSPAMAEWASHRANETVLFDAFGNIFETDILWLVASGITKGCDPPANTLFCPDDPVTRGQMAAFLRRALEPLIPATGTAIDFTDTDGSVFENDIAWLARSGITKGCNPPANTRFCPDQRLTRGQMAAFLVRAGLTD